MDIWDILTFVASLLLVAASFTASPELTPRWRWVIAVLLAFGAVVTFFRYGSPWARLEGVSIMLAAVVFAKSAHRMAKTNPAART